MMNVLVVGGAGYVGSHAVRLLTRAGYTVWVYDNCQRGHRAAVPANLLIEGDLLNHQQLVDVLRKKSIDAVMHFAAFALVGESMSDPASYYQNNVVGTLTLLDAMRTANVRRMVFSSTCATYGIPQSVPISEEHPQMPVNPYGFTKLAIEWALHDYAHAYDLGFVALRYFNAAGASPDGDIGEDHTPESHLIPLVLQTALGQRKHVAIFGEDYPTSDGTCIRDYIHVDDLGTAHIKALEQVTPGVQLKLNLGTGCGTSVRSVIEVSQRVTGRKIPTVVGDRRAGDPPELVADSRCARRQLDWEPQYLDLEQIVETAWHWHHAHPHGYAL
jgi:UDP-glucose-4-epimerase GalE